MQPVPLSRKQILVDRLGQERVPGRVPVGVGVDHEHVLVDRRSEPPVQLGGVVVGELGDGLVTDPTASCRDHPQHRDARLRELVHPGQHQVAQSRWKPLSGRCRQKLFGVQRVPRERASTSPTTAPDGSIPRI